VAERGVSTGGGGRNAEYLEPRVAWGDTDSVMRAILVDPQTSGGLLVAVPASALDDYLSRVAEAVQIGAVVAREQVDIVLS
jgi:selenide,water dikinase